MADRAKVAVLFCDESGLFRKLVKFFLGQYSRTLLKLQLPPWRCLLLPELVRFPRIDQEFRR